MLEHHDRRLRVLSQRISKICDKTIRNGSVSTWKHFNLHGEFDFSDERMVDSMGLEVPKNPDWKSD
ncbi:hypothetical protein [Methylomonas sp. AM2-LC]|uniref:hypothetical protein n=1 Tax=Methylomonas sp. AM2-LC TaxID=3153301 RepID=UPI0032672054